MVYLYISLPVTIFQNLGFEFIKECVNSDKYIIKWSIPSLPVCMKINSKVKVKREFNTPLIDTDSLMLTNYNDATI